MMKASKTLSVLVGIKLLCVQVMHGHVEPSASVQPSAIHYMYAPWRTAHKDPTKPRHDCVFCGKLQKNDDANEFVLKRYKYHVVMLNLYPYNPGHLLIVPLEHVRYIDLLTKDAQHELIEVMAYCVEVTKKVCKSDALNVGLNMGRAAGASVPDHLHVHIVPRFEGDTSFFPVTAQTVVCSFDMLKIFAQFKEYFSDMQ